MFECLVTGVWSLFERIRRARRCGLARSVLLQVEFEEFQKTKKPMPGPGPDTPLLPSDQGVKFSAIAPGPCLSASHHDDHGLT